MKGVLRFFLKIYDFSKKNYGVLGIFVFSTFVFLFIHKTVWSWDFTSYVLNAQFLFSNGLYFEPLRPPLMPVMIWLLSFFGFDFAGYLFIFFTSLLFMYSSIKLADALKFNRFFFYLMSINSYVLFFGLINGTELLSFALLELFVAFIIEDKNSGFFLGLSSISRYSIFALAPLIFFQRGAKKILKNLVFFALPIIPWFIYNFVFYGNFFMSIADSYALNFYYRGYLLKPLLFSDIFYPFVVFWPFFVLGALIVAVSWIKSRKFDFYSHRADTIMIYVFVFTIFKYSRIPMRDERYLFTLMLPLIYFSYIGIEKIASFFKLRFHFKKNAFGMIVPGVLFFILFLSSFYFFNPFDQPRSEGFSAIKSEISSLGITNCSIMSNRWLVLDYVGIFSVPADRKELVSYYLDEGYYFVLFKGDSDLPYVDNESFMKSLPVIYDNSDFYVLGNLSRCVPQKKYDITYMDHLNNSIYKIYNYSTITDPCQIMFGKGMLFKVCRFVNFK